jgi:nucleoid-associated protein YejK
MSADDPLSRIDAHMARGNELMEQNRAAFHDLRTFLRDMTLRQEKVMRGMLARLEEQSTEIREQTNVLRQEGNVLRQQTESIREGREEFVQESRAQRAALFRMLNRLDGGDSPAAA